MAIPTPHSLFMARFFILLAVLVAVVACTSDDEAPVATFEDFYAATASKDVATVRALLCPAERRILGAAADDVLLQAFSVVKVVKRVTLESRNDAAAVVVVQDALSQTTRVQLRHDLNGRLGWCIAGPVVESAPVTP